DGTGEHLVRFKQHLLSSHEEHCLFRALELLFELAIDTLTECLIADQLAVELCDAEIGFGERHLDVAYQVNEEGKIRHHRAHQRQVALGKMRERVAYPEPGGQLVAARCPPKAPGEGAQSGQTSLPAAARRARADADVLQFCNRCGL